ncbi:UDP-glycosyltransferase 89C1-like [Durio zibethinus]|uniref:UDP-glycosyltransferase 89C1-like n=1 Tax=Durio zibethinus TaxID=66656 RepID=A0A6P6B5R9_DURZI|nr:UDP-glycosyltransferase 89C1-like [Durio zibethinus]
MATQGDCNGVHILTIPFPAAGHILPHMDLIHQFVLRGLTVTILVTPKNLHYLNPLLSFHSSSNVQTLVLPFPSHSSIPPGVENMQDVTLSFAPDFVTALSKLYDPLVQWFHAHRYPPVAILSDMLLSSWVNSLASHLNIQNLSFSVLNANSMFHWMVKALKVRDDAFSTGVDLVSVGSWGLIFNTFTELDGAKMNMIKEEFTKHDRLWAVGPLLPIKASSMGSNERGGPSSIQQDQVVAWLDSCQSDKTVVYVGFGTQITLTKQQMDAVASALEESGVRFIWAVKDPMKGKQNGDDQNVVPRGFEERVGGRGLVIKGWTPQLAILEHQAVGSYLTHCGWNSVLEGLLGGVLLLAWPMQVDHFDNTKLLVDELGVAIRVCEGLDSVPDATKLARILSDSVSMDRFREERNRAMQLRKTALAAIQKGGSSDEALECLVEELCSLNINAEEKEIKPNNK